ncbi:MAG TPA: cell envelope integrity protein CreD [Candidatus Didemnitutus sp.]|jgi:inner membrane protein
MNSIPPVIPPAPPPLPPRSPRRVSIIAKLAYIGGLLILLQIPVGLTHGVLKDRRGYQEQAAAEISRSWGHSQAVAGPILAVPYWYQATAIHQRVVNGRKVDVEENELVAATAYFLPDNLTADGSIDPEVRSRGIYDTVVYTLRLKMTARFQPDFGAARIEADQIDWDHARVLVSVSDLHGLRSLGPLHYGADRSVGFETSATQTEASHFLFGPTPMVPGSGPLEISFDAICQGSDAVTFAPVGQNTRVTVRSPWPDPSFVGATLPVRRSVGAQGFDATWESVQFSHPFPASWSSRSEKNDDMMKRIADSGFGVRFARPIDAYGMVERAQKYATLFFVLIFNAFFLFELTAGLRIHPTQYAMVGAALCLFFLGFLALTEFWPTAWAYLAAAGACTALISLYAWSFLHSGGRTVMITAGLTATYGYLYFVLQSQDYALLAGTLALFAGLAIAMYGTRRFNWYTTELSGAVAAGATE